MYCRTISHVGINKAAVVRDYLNRGSISAEAFIGSWQDFVSSGGLENGNYDLWLPLANEDGVRASMQANVPPLMVQASTKRDWGVNHGRHIPFVDDCILDRFPSGTNDSQLQCSEGPLPEAKGQQPDAALPFLSALAGLLVVAELFRLKLPKYPCVPNFASLDLRHGIQIQAWDRIAAPNCICRQIPAEIWWKRHGDTRYAGLSRT